VADGRLTPAVHGARTTRSLAPASRPEDGTVDHFSYFMLRLQRSEAADAASVVTGIVQQLSTGEKRTFDDADELLALLLAWSHPRPPKLEPGAGESNAVVS
jgi:hypothetical protein